MQQEDDVAQKKVKKVLGREIKNGRVHYNVTYEGDNTLVTILYFIYVLFITKIRFACYQTILETDRRFYKRRLYADYPLQSPGLQFIVHSIHIFIFHLLTIFTGHGR